MDGGNVGAGHFFCVAWPDVKNIRHGAVESGNGNGLVGRSVLTNANTVVGGNVNLLEALKRGHAHTSSGVQVEDKVGACHGDKSAFVEGRKPVGDGAHGVLANTVVDISTAVVSVQLTSSLEFGLVLH